MKKALIVALLVVGVSGGLWMARGWTLRRQDEKVAQFNLSADNLIVGLQKYREFVGNYPPGDNAEVAKALLGKAEKKVFILAVRRSDMNDKGEILDPWGTPLQFYFSHNEVLVRSAGPDKIWEDSGVPFSDDLYRCAPKERK